mmetsp:Transcript_32594/g.92403  ORF Transcript_32594/g.92403 Transcript_32594/m.92403 type:complete len:202 (-) Transcript_32594:2012-2617(-)
MPTALVHRRSSSSRVASSPVSLFGRRRPASAQPLSLPCSPLPLLAHQTATLIVRMRWPGWSQLPMQYCQSSPAGPRPTECTRTHLATSHKGTSGASKGHARCVGPAKSWPRSGIWTPGRRARWTTTSASSLPLSLRSRARCSSWSAGGLWRMPSSCWLQWATPGGGHWVRPPPARHCWQQLSLAQRMRQLCLYPLLPGERR